MKIKLFGALLLVLALIVIWFLYSRNNASVEQVVQDITPISTSLPTTSPGSNSISFLSILTKPPSEKLQQIRGQFYEDVFKLFKCSDSTKVLMLTVKSSEGTYVNAMQTVEASRDIFINDLGYVVFPLAKSVLPDVQQDSILVNKKNPDVSTEGLTRVPVLVDNKAKFLWYGWTLNYIFIGSTQECVEGAMIDVYPAD